MLASKRGKCARSNFDRIPEDVLRHVCGYCVSSLQELFALYLVSRHCHKTLSKPVMLLHFEVSLASCTQLLNLGSLAAGLRAVAFEMAQDLDTLPLSLTSLNLSGSNVDQTELFSILPTLSNLTALDVGDCYFQELGIREMGTLAALPLRTLKIGGSEINEAGLLCSMHALHTLDLTSLDYLTMCNIVISVGNLTALHTLVLDYAAMDDYMLEYLTPLSKTLQHLSLNRTKMTDTGLQSLPRFRQLRTLSLAGCDQLTTKSVQCVATLAQLRVLCLSNCGDLSLSPLSALSQLEKLDISGNPPTSLAPLQNLHSLRQLHIGGWDLSEIAQLRAHVPDLRILQKV